MTKGSSRSNRVLRVAYTSALMDDNRWRELCRLIMTEQDPVKLWALVNELNKTFDDREQELRRLRNPMNEGSSTESSS
jgi:hypothetical protein